MTSSASRVADYREKLRAQGLRPLQIWVRDTRSAAYNARIQAQCLALSDHPDERRIMDDLDALADRENWT